MCNVILIFRRFSLSISLTRRVSLYAEANPSILLPSIFIFLYFCFLFSCSLRFIISVSWHFPIPFTFRTACNYYDALRALRTVAASAWKQKTHILVLPCPAGYNSCLLVNFCFKPLIWPYTSSRRVRGGVHIVLLIKCIILWRLHTKHSVVYPFSNKSIRLLTALFHMTT